MGAMEWDQALERLSTRPTGAQIGRRRVLQAILAGGALSAVPAYVRGTSSAWAVADPGTSAAGSSAGSLATAGSLVVVNLAGGNDWMNTVVPADLDRYGSLRGNVALDRSGLLPLTGGLALHPALTNTKRIWDDGHLAIVQGVGFADPTLSHFDAAARWMSASSTGIGSTGWVGRFLDVAGPGNGFAGIHIGSSIPLLMRGAQPLAVSLPESMDGALGAMRTRTTKQGTEPDRDNLRLFSALSEMAQGRRGTTLADRWAANASRALDTAAGIAPLYGGLPKDPQGLVHQMAVAARVLSAGLGTRVVSVTQGAYDTHDNQLVTHATRLGELDTALSVFFAGLDASAAGNVTVLVVSEFGRRAGSNGSSGTDHGTAGAALLAGAPVKGGLYGTASSLTQLDRSGNLVATVDMRSVFATALAGSLSADDRRILGASFDHFPLLTSAN
jgi:uncharacterized protein (DUF1501 family)